MAITMKVFSINENRSMFCFSLSLYSYRNKNQSVDQLLSYPLSILAFTLNSRLIVTFISKWKYLLRARAIEKMANRTYIGQEKILSS